MSASLHILNSKSRKLFQKAILFSGSAMNPVLPRVKDHTSIVQNLGDLHFFVCLFQSLRLHMYFINEKMNLKLILCIIQLRMRMT